MTNIIKRKTYKVAGKTFWIILFTCSVFLIIPACQPSHTGQEHDIMDISMDTANLRFTYQNVQYTLPSPQQTMHFIVKNNISFAENLLNKPENYTKYNTSYKKSINLGIFGADLGYLNVYNRLEEGERYIQVITKLLQDLELNFPETNELIRSNRFLDKDSLFSHMAKLYSQADDYLKQSGRPETSALIVAGGWIESLYLLVMIHQESGDEKIFDLIIQQKSPLDHLVLGLAPHVNRSSEIKDFVEILVDLAYDFDVIDQYYQFEKPHTTSEMKHTNIHSETRFALTGSSIENITRKIQDIRNQIIE